MAPPASMRASFAAIPVLALVGMAWAGDARAAASDDVAQSFLWVALILVCAKLGALVARLRQPVVLGELLAGMVLGNLAFAGLSFGGLIEADAVVQFLAQLGAVILLFQLGLESNVASMRRVGARAFWVAAVGVALPFLLGTYLVGPWLLPGMPFAAYLFLGAALTATSVGITGRVLRDLGALRSDEAQIVLGAASKKFPFPKAADMVLDSFRDFLPEFGQLAKRVFDENHLDSEIRKGKRSGAFSILPPRSAPKTEAHECRPENAGRKWALLVGREKSH